MNAGDDVGHPAGAVFCGSFLLFPNNIGKHNKVYRAFDGTHWKKEPPNDLGEYEKEYLGRLEEQGPPDEIKKRLEAGQRKRLKAEQRKRLKTISTWDYVFLECVRKGDMRMALRIGPEHAFYSLEKVLFCDLIRKIDRALSLDERMLIQEFLDSAEYRQYRERFQKVITFEEENTMVSVLNDGGIRKNDGMVELTQAGRQNLGEKREEMLRLWNGLESLRAKDGDAFRKAADASLTCLPLLLVMGISHGAIMGYMMSESTVNHTHGITEFVNASWSTSDAGWDGGDFDTLGAVF